MELTVEELALEKKEILRRYRALLRSAAPFIKTAEDKTRIRKAFDIALDAHKDMRRKSGEPYIYHPLAVAKIAVEEIGLGVTSIICALLHDVVEDTDITLSDLEKIFGKKVTKIIDGLTKIEGVFDQTSSIQAENFRKIVLTLSEDVRVILLKLADRLHNMRTLEHMSRKGQLKIASETLYLYAPLAHRLGLYSIKSELEDLALKYKEPETYNEIVQKLKKSEDVRNRFIRSFTHPIKKALAKEGYTFEIKGRTKSIHSIYDKIKNKGLQFEEIYDIFAIRIILDTPLEREKSDCWNAYSIVTDFYQPKPDRLRDWISLPKANGYESLHTTVMSPTGKWVEVQIRTKRMDEVAEKGYAAHWKYKEKGVESAIDEWLKQIRSILENDDKDALDFIDDFKLNLYTKEIYVFTPKGELKTLPKGSTVLDFAYDIHSQIGDTCIGAKINNKLEPISYQLRSGDQIEIITSAKQRPKEDWLKHVITAKAKSKIKDALKEDKRRIAQEGKEIFERKLRHLKLNFSSEDTNKILKFFNVQSILDFYYKVGIGVISNEKIKEFYKKETQLSWYSYLKKKLARGSSSESDKKIPSVEELAKEVNRNGNELVIGNNLDKIVYKLSPCCNPIPGDEVFGYTSSSDGIKIHKTNCPNATELMSNFANRIVKVRWTNSESPSFLAGIKVGGFDEVGIVNKITKIISNQHKVNMRSISFDTKDSIFEGNITVFVQDTNHLEDLIKKIKSVDGVINVERMN